MHRINHGCRGTRLTESKADFDQVAKIGLLAAKFFWHKGAEKAFLSKSCDGFARKPGVAIDVLSMGRGDFRNPLGAGRPIVSVETGRKLEFARCRALYSMDHAAVPKSNKSAYGHVVCNGRSRHRPGAGA